MPYSLNVPTFGILAATLLDYGTPEQQARHLPKILMGEELWVQFLSEPSGGSDLAGCLTRADRDGDVWVMNGAKIWSSGACRRRLRDVPGPHELGRPEAPRPDDVHHADPPARRAGRPDPPGRRVDGVLPGVLRRRAHPGRERHRRGRRRLDGRVAAARATSASPPAAARPTRADAPAATTRTTTTTPCSTSSGPGGSRGTSTSGSWWPRPTSARWCSVR